MPRMDDHLRLWIIPYFVFPSSYELIFASQRQQELVENLIESRSSTNPFFLNLFIEALLGQSIFQESSAIRGVIPKWITPSGAESRWATAASAINYARIPGILQEGQWLASLSCVALRLSPTESFLFVSPASPHLDWVTPSWNDFELTSLGFNRILPDIT